MVGVNDFQTLSCPRTWCLQQTGLSASEPAVSVPPPPLERETDCSPAPSPAPVYRSLPSKSGISAISWSYPWKAKAQLWGLSGRVSSLCSQLFPASSSVRPLTQLTLPLLPPPQPGLNASHRPSPAAEPEEGLLPSPFS